MGVKLKVSVHRTLQIVSVIFLMSLTSGQVNFVTCTIISQFGKNQVPKIFIRYLQLVQNDELG